MADMIAEALAALTETFVEHASRPVNYVRKGEGVILDVPATIGPKLLKVDGGGLGLRFEYTDMDFLIAARFLISPVTSKLFLPEEGDLIYATMTTDVQEFRIFPFGSEPAWRWADPNQTMFRIHTKLIGNAVL